MTTHEQVWQILLEECGAQPFTGSVREKFWDFRFRWPRCREYRFMGSLGFGGKIWDANGRWYVNCYAEDRTPERDAMIERANRRLAELRASMSEAAE